MDNDDILPHGGAHPVSHVHRRFPICMHEDNPELLAAKSRDAIHRPNLRIQPARHFLQHRVAHEMTMSVVHRLEVIDVHHDQRDRVPEPDRSLALLLEDAIQFAPVQQAGELIPRRQPAQLLERLAQFQRITQRPLHHPRCDLALDQIVERPRVHRLDVDALRALGRQEHDRRPAAGGHRLADQLQAVALAQLVVEEAGRINSREQLREPRFISGRPFQIVTSP